MNFKTTIGLFAVMIVMLGVLVVSLRYHTEAIKRDEEGLFPVAGGKAKDRQVRAEGKRPDSLKGAGLDSPSRIITIEAKDKDRTLTLTVGEVVPGTEGIAYVQSSERGSNPLAVSKTSIESALEDDPIGYFRNKDL